jgi:deoxyribodipyrimidine photo-lyase
VTRVPQDPSSRVPAARLRRANDAPVARGEWVVYWMIAARRATSSFGLERALEWSRALQRPLVVLEPLRAGYEWASERLHRFVLDGMAHNARAFAERGVAYWPYVEPRPGAGKGLLEALAARAALVVTDEFPCFFLPRMVAAAARSLPVRLEVVDSNGLVPLRATPAAFATAFAFRRWLQANLAEHLEAFPLADPLHAADFPAPPDLGRVLATRWPAAADELLAGDPRALAALPIDHAVGPVRTPGGSGEARRELASFVAHKLARYGERRNHPDDEGSSGFSPYLHFGHLSAHEVFAAVTGARGWTRARLSDGADGKRGWYGLDPSAEEFLEQLVTWRELGYGFAWHRSDHERYESLPDWARATLEENARPGRTYALEELEKAATHDALWNAAQTELLRTGKLHNYLRMLWGKKILEWSPSPREAFARTIHLNNKYALDGRDPNSYSGISWCLGRFDRPWGPKRPVFGTVRYMSSESTARKLDLADYLERFGPARPERPEPLEPRPPRKTRRRARGMG